MPSITAQQAADMLGVTLPASDEAIRAAYTDRIRRHPPDRDPELFEQIRDAYDLLRDPLARARLVLEGPDPGAPLASVLPATGAPRQFAGIKMWMEVLKEKRS
jgi:DnaJ-class molecular chaperone